MQQCVPTQDSTITAKTILTLFAGIFCGIFGAICLSWILTANSEEKTSLYNIYNLSDYENVMTESQNDGGVYHKNVSPKLTSITSSFKHTQKQHNRILIMVMVAVNNYNRTIGAILNTWGKKCDSILFFGTVADDKYPIIVLNTTEGRMFLWEKTKFAFMYIYNQYIDDFDWFVKADDDTFIIMENLDYFLMDMDPSKPHYFGCPLNKIVNQGYMSGGASYVLSNKAVRMFIKTMNAKLCRRDHDGSEDAEMGNCLEKAGVSVGDSRDAHGLGRFFPFSPELHVRPHENESENWFKSSYAYYTNKTYMCSEESLSFHYIYPEHMYGLYYTIYYLKPYGITSSVTVMENQVYND